MTALLIAIGGGVGAVARWGVATAIPKSHGGFPVGITVVNVVGSFALGLIVGSVAGGQILFATEPLTIGLLGGFTTFSTWMVDIEEAPRRRMRLATTLVPSVAGLLAAAAGIALGINR
ncbi:MAG: hypothetical protein BMS9Abin12_1805 [Acidimicrobiia bacterium]|nr:MAG: hypothetical protein BMS9Abin12_1805 [Acidimicrobiia bacterium]